jgi:hypothetical protein
LQFILAETRTEPPLLRLITHLERCLTVELGPVQATTVNELRRRELLAKLPAKKALAGAWRLGVKGGSVAKKSSGVPRKAKPQSVSDLEEARRLFQEAGLAFPEIPDEIAARLKKRKEWLFSTREVEVSPYSLQDYVREVERTPVEDYVILAHSGHGVNSYAIQYYLVRGALQMFLHLGWGGVYSNPERDALKIHHCFALADKIVRGVQNVGNIRASSTLRIVGSDFYGSYWLAPGQGGPGKMLESARRPDEGPTVTEKDPTVTLTEALHWLERDRTA